MATKLTCHRRGSRRSSRERNAGERHPSQRQVLAAGQSEQPCRVEAAGRPLFPPRVALVIPTYNEAEYIASTLTALLDGAEGYGHDQIEIFVVDGGSTDGTPDIVRRLTRRWPSIRSMRLLHNPQRLQAVACNLALRASRGAELLMRCDAHAYYPSGFIARAVHLLDQHGADGVVYSDRPLAGNGARNAFQHGVGFAQNNRLGVGQSHYRLGTFSGWVEHGKHGCFRRDLLLAAGGYDEAFAVNEDSELSYRLVQRGARLWLDQELWVGYVPRSRPGALARQYFLYGQGRVQNLRKHARHPTPRQWAPAALVLGQFAALGAAHWRPETLLLPGLYTAALGGIASAGAYRRQRWALLWSAPAMAIMHFAFGAGFLARFVRPGNGASAPALMPAPAGAITASAANLDERAA